MPSDVSTISTAADGAPALAPAIDGIVPAHLVAPETSQDVADCLAEVADRRNSVAPVGGGTALGLGNVPKHIDIALSTHRLGNVLDYEPMDLVLSVGAGAQFGDVQAILAEHGQTIPIEAPHDADATVGGLIATALAGPRRLGSGTLRDLLIGISVAHPSGTVTKAGGMVVKNVTGFDLTRLYLGSLGTLGIIVSANFKVLPLPRSETTVLAQVPDVERAIAAAAAVRSSSLQPVALEITTSGTGWAVAVRLEGRESTVAAMADRVADLVKSDTERLDAPASVAWWRAYVDAQGPSVASARAMVVHLGVRPRSTAELLRQTVTLVSRHSLTMTYVAVSPGIGSIVARLEAESAIDAAFLTAIHGSLLEIADSATIVAADPAAKAGIDVWGRMPETIDLMRTLKSQFDPGNVLNPGRFAGRI